MMRIIKVSTTAGAVGIEIKYFIYIVRISMKLCRNNNKGWIVR